MPPAAIGAVFTYLGASAATGAAVTAVASAVYVGAAYGAAVGAVGALVTGGDVLDGAVKGAVVGGVSGGILKGFDIASAGGVDAWHAKAGAKPVDTAGLKAPPTESGVTPPDSQVPDSPPIKNPPNTPPPENKGILARTGRWIEKNPTQAMLLGQTVGGMAQGMAEGRSKEKEVEAAMERDRLNIAAQKVGGLSKMDLMIELPSIAEFTKKPEWQMPEAGILSKEAKHARA